MGAEPKEKWYREVRIDDEPLPEPRLNGMTAPPEKLMDKVDRTIRTTMKVSLTLLTWFICISVGWFSCLNFGKPTYNQAAAQLANEGLEEAAKALPEFGEVCPDARNTPISCGNLFKGLKEKSKELAQK